MTKYLHVILRKTLSGKSTLQNKLESQFNISKIITTTTRPKREFESNDIDYHFVNIDQYMSDNKNNQTIATRIYNVINHEKWIYYISKQELLNMNQQSCLVIDYDGYLDLKKYIQNNDLDIKLYPWFLDIDLKTRIDRYFKTNRSKENHIEVLRRLYSDELNFKDITKKSPEIKTIKGLPDMLATITYLNLERMNQNK